jgi:hypothetical protein
MVWHVLQQLVLQQMENVLQQLEMCCKTMKCVATTRNMLQQLKRVVLQQQPDKVDDVTTMA